MKFRFRKKKKIEKVLSLEVCSIILLRQLVSSVPPFQATPIFLLDKNKFCSVVSKLSNKRKMDRPTIRYLAQIPKQRQTKISKTYIQKALLKVVFHI